MKKLCLIPICSVVFAGGVTLISSYAQEPAGDPFGGGPAGDGIPRPRLAQVGILVEWIEMDARAANKLVRKHLTQAGPAGIPNALRDEVEKLVDAGDAAIKDSNYVMTKSGQRAKTESVDEIIYPTEYEPPKIPDTQVLVGASQKPPAATATSFETRNVGTTMEVDPVIDETETLIDINIAPEWVEFEGRDYLGRDGTPNEETGDMWMPKFNTMRGSTAATLRDGEAQLLFVARPKAEGKLVLVFVQASILR